MSCIYEKEKLLTIEIRARNQRINKYMNTLNANMQCFILNMMFCHSPRSVITKNKRIVNV